MTIQTLLPPERWADLRSLFGSVIELEPQARRKAIDQCDPALRSALSRLVRNYDASSAFLRSGALSPDRVLEYLASGYQVFETDDVVANRFRVARFIGEGGMGEVYEAEDCELGGQVAIKTVRPELAAEAGMIERFKREIQLARRVTHPNVCRVFDLFRHPVSGGPDIVFLTMELLAGETLSERIRNGNRLIKREAAGIAAGIANGLDAAHAAGIVHGDLKPGNVILVARDEQERAVITDFGLAMELVGAGYATAAGGTPAYVAPEQVEGGQVTFAADIYSFGVLLYEIFAGALPFQHADPAELARLRLTKIPAAPRAVDAGVSKNWDRAILACLERDPAKRPRTATACVRMAQEAGPSRRYFAAAGILSVAAAGYAALRRERPAIDGDSSAHMQRANLFLGRRTAGDVQNAISEYQHVLKNNPRYVPAWLGLAESYSVSANFHFSDFRTSLEAAIQAAETAVRLDTHSARAYGLLAYCTSIDVRRWLTCEPGFRRALTLDPRDPQVRMWYGSYLGKCGRSDEAIASVQAALREDPTSLSLNQQLAWEFYRARRMDESVRQAEDLITLQPRDPMSYIAAARAYEWKGEFEKALAAVVEIERYGDPLASECLRASIEGRRGNAELARGIASKLRPEWEKGVVESVLLAEIYCQTHDNERAVETLNAGFDRSDPSVLKAAHHPSFEVLKSDRGFQKFLSRIGLPAG